MRNLAYGLSLMLAACFWRISPTDSIIVSGTALEGDGIAAAGVEIELIRGTDPIQQGFGDPFVPVATFGLACLAQSVEAQSVDLCRPFAKATTDSRGGYQFGLRGEETLYIREALQFTALHHGSSTPSGASGRAGVAVDFYVKRTRVEIPGLRLWESLGSESASASGVTFSWPSLSSAIGGGAAGYRLVISVGGDLLWTQSSTSTSTTIDPRVTQDFAGSWSVWATRGDSGDGTDFDFTYYSPAVAYASKMQLPKSRGKDCYVQGNSGPVQQSPCPLTDGKLSTSFEPVGVRYACQPNPCPTPPLNTWVYVDLGRSEPLSALVLYDTWILGGGMITVEGSDDATQWTTLTTTAASSFKLVTLSGSARYVRLKLDETRSFSSGGNREIAIY